MLSWLCFSMSLLVVGADAGPRLSDAEFFGGLDLKQPGLKAVASAVKPQDWPAARAAYAQYFKQRDTPRWFAELPSLPWAHCPPKAPKVRPETTRADKVLGHQFRFSMGTWFDLGEDVDWSSNLMTEGESATVEWNAQLNRHFHFRDLAGAYRRTGEEKYAAEIVAQMLDWIEDCPVLLNKSGNSPYHYAWETLNTAVRAGDTWPGALYAILPSGALTDDALCTIAKSLVEHARHLDRWPTRSGNWLTAESKALFVVGTLLPEFREAKIWREHAIGRLYRQMHTDVYPDGLEIELALGYNNWVLSNFATVLELARMNDHLDEFPDDYLRSMEKMYEYQAYAVMPNGRVPGLNDSGGASPAGLLRDGLGYFPQREDFLFVATSGKEGKRPEKTSIAFPYSGHYVMRSGWNKGARYLLMDAGPFGSGHQHEDKLHLIVCAYGRQLLLDAGNYMYDRSRWRRYVLSTRGHNTIRIDGQDQNRRRRRETWVLPMPFGPLKNTWVSTERFDYVVARYQSGYGPKGELDVTHTRAVVFVKPDYWIIIDTLEANDDREHTYESLFHLNAQAAHVDQPTGAVLTDNPDDANLVIFPMKSPSHRGGKGFVTPMGVSVEVVRGIEEEPVQGWANNPWRPVPTAIFRGKVAGRRSMVTVLYPLAAGARSPVRAVEPLTVSVPSEDVTSGAVAAEIRFHDGHVHTVLHADRSGVRRRYGGFETEAALHFTDTFEGRTESFHHP